MDSTGTQSSTESTVIYQKMYNRHVSLCHYQIFHGSVIVIIGPRPSELSISPFKAFKDMWALGWSWGWGKAGNPSSPEKAEITGRQEEELGRVARFFSVGEPALTLSRQANMTACAVHWSEQMDDTSGCVKSQTQPHNAQRLRNLCVS